MLFSSPSKKFLKDVERDRVSGRYKKHDFDTLKQIISSLLEQKMLDKKLKDHALKGNWQGYRECHIKPDWLLVYRVDEEKAVLNLARLGTHNQIFNR
jgi:mRNA interferase YafQ